MDAKLRGFLKRHGVSDDTIAKLERGDAPDDPQAALRKAEAIDATERLRKLDPNSPALAQIDEMNELLYGVDGAKGLIREIKEGLARVLGQDAKRESAARGVEEFNKGHTNGHAIDLPNFLRGLRP